MPTTNRDISRKLREEASNLAHTRDNLYRVRAYRRAALAVLALPEEVSTIVAAGGKEGLKQVPGIGKSLAETIAGYVRSEKTETGPLAV